MWNIKRLVLLLILPYLGSKGLTDNVLAPFDIFLTTDFVLQYKFYAACEYVHGDSQNLGLKDNNIQIASQSTTFSAEMFCIFSHIHNGSTEYKFAVHSKTREFI